MNCSTIKDMKFGAINSKEADLGLSSDLVGLKIQVKYISSFMDRSCNWFDSRD